MSDLVRNPEGRFSSNAAQFSVGGNWTDWTVWSSCSQTCGDGQMTRGRFCVNPRPENGGQDCEGAAEEQQTCNLGNCPGNGWVCFFVCVDVCFLNLNSLLVKRQIDNPSPGAVTGGN